MSLCDSPVTGRHRPGRRAELPSHSDITATTPIGKPLFLIDGVVLLEFAPRGGPQAAAYPK